MRPLALARNLLRGRAWSAVIWMMRRLSRPISMLFSALVAADCTTLATVLAQGEVSRFRVSRASFTPLPRTRSMIGFSRLGEAPTCLATARTAGITSPHPAGALGAGHVPPIGAGGGELPQTVPHHVLGDEDRDMAASVVDDNGLPHHLR